MNKTTVGDAFRLRRVIVMLAVTAAALAAAYASVFAFWWTRWFEPGSYYSHSPFVPFASVALVVVSRKKIASLPLRPSTLGIPVMLVAMFAGWIGWMTATMSLMGLMLPVYILGAVIAILGRPAARALWFPVFFLIFMAVLPETLTEQASFRVQMASTRLSAMLLSGFGLDAVFHGARLDLAHSSVQVGEACSGFRLLISHVAVGVFLAHIRDISLWRRVGLVAVAAPLGLAINVLRISVIASIGEFRGRSTMLTMHDWTGWLVILLAAAIMLRISRPRHANA
jgi:exosortase